MSNITKSDLHLVAQADFHTFVRLCFPVLHGSDTYHDAPYLHLITTTLQDVYSEPGRNQIINMPPRFLKSFIASVCFSAWVLGKHPGTKIMIASHTMALSKEHLGNLRRLMKSEDYQKIFTTRIGDKDSETEFKTRKGGGALAVSFEAAPTGRGCDYLIIDDPIKVDAVTSPQALADCATFCRQALFSRVNNQGEGHIILVMQRLAPADLTGRLIEGGAFENVLSLPLVAMEHEEIAYIPVFGPPQIFSREPGELLNPARMPLEAVEKLKARLSDADFAAQYQQRPMTGGGSIVKKEWLCHVDVFVPQKGVVVMSCDMATKTGEGASYSVFQAWRITGDGFFELHDVFRDRIPPEEAGGAALRFARLHSPNIVLVEDMNAGLLVADALKGAGFFVETIHPTQSKEQRLLRCLSAFHALKVRLPRNAPWRDAFEAELLAFPGSRYDDQVDATSQALNFAVSYTLGEIKIAGFRPNGFYIAKGTPRPKDHPLRPRPRSYPRPARKW